MLVREKVVLDWLYCKLVGTVLKGVQAPAAAQLAETQKHMTPP